MLPSFIPIDSLVMLAEYKLCWLLRDKIIDMENITLKDIERKGLTVLQHDISDDPRVVNVLMLEKTMYNTEYGFLEKIV